MTDEYTQQIRKKFIGVWKVFKTKPSSAASTHAGLEGTTFELTASGVVKWHPLPGCGDSPLFDCDSYEVIKYNCKGLYLDDITFRLGMYRGHDVDFKVDKRRLSKNQLLLTKDWTWILSYLIKAPPKVSPLCSRFSLLPAFENGLFSDLTITADSGKQYAVHKCILRLIAKKLDWDAVPPPLSGLPEKILDVSLHYLYAQCLPEALPISVAQDIVMNQYSDMRALKGLRTLCADYITHQVVSEEMSQQMSDVLACGARLRKRFRGEQITVVSALWEAILDSLKDIAVACAKILLICKIYNESKGMMSDEAGPVLIEYLKTQSLLVVSDIKSCMTDLSHLLKNLPCVKKLDLILYLVPEIGLFLKAGLEVATVAATILEENPSLCIQRDGESSLDYDLKRLSMCKKRSNGYHALSMQVKEKLVQELEYLQNLTEPEKIEALYDSLNQLISEFPIFTLRMDDISSSINDRFEAHKSDFCFKVAVAKVCNVIGKLVKKRESIQSLLINLCLWVGQIDLTETLVKLELLTEEDMANLIAVGQMERNNSAPEQPEPDAWEADFCASFLRSAMATLPPCPNAMNNSAQPDEATEPTDTADSAKMTDGDVFSLNLTQSHCEPPLASLSRLSKAGAKMQNDRTTTDMTLLVEQYEIPAHRAIVGARCEWFERALLSGMQESLNRRIDLAKVPWNVFETFICFLYVGDVVKPDCLTHMEALELLVMADCYGQKELFVSAQLLIAKLINSEVVAVTLNVADRLNATMLRKDCITYIASRYEVLSPSIYEDLTDDMHDEIKVTAKDFKKRWAYISTKCSKEDGEKRKEPEGKEDST